jgi:hypothetical protein
MKRLTTPDPVAPKGKKFAAMDVYQTPIWLDHNLEFQRIKR